MTDSLSIIDPTSYSRMDIVQMPDREALLSARMSSYVAIWVANDPPMGAVYDVEMLEFDPHKVTQEACTVYHLSVLTRINQAARACTLAFAQGRDLDTIASRFPGGVPRTADEIYDYDTALVPERRVKDNRYRQRIWMSPFKLARGSTAYGYRYDAMTLTSARDVSVSVRRDPEQVSTIVCLLMNRWDSPAPTKPELLDAYRLLTAPELVQNTDVLAVRPVVVIPKHYIFVVFFNPYADEAGTLTKIDEAATAFLQDDAFYIGRDIGRQEVEGLCDLPGVHHVEIEGFGGGNNPEVEYVEAYQVIRATHEVTKGRLVPKRGVLL